MPDILGRFLCFLGMHDLELIDATFGFGAPGSISKFRCRRCGDVKTKVL